MLAIRLGRRPAGGAGGGLAEPLAEGRSGARMPSYRDAAGSGM